MADSKESDMSDVYEIDVILPDGRERNYFEINIQNTVGQELARICEETELNPMPEKVMVLVTRADGAKVMNNDDPIDKYREDLSGGHIEIQLRSDARDRPESDPQPEILNYSLK